MKLKVFDKLCAHVRASSCFIFTVFFPLEGGALCDSAGVRRRLALRWRPGSCAAASRNCSVSPASVCTHLSPCACRFSKFQTVLLEDLGSILPWAKTRKAKTSNAGLWEEGRRPASASRCIDLYRFFSETAIPETSFSASYHQAALLFFFLPFFFFFKLDTTTGDSDNDEQFDFKTLSEEITVNRVCLPKETLSAIS